MQIESSYRQDQWGKITFPMNGNCNGSCRSCNAARADQHSAYCLFCVTNRSQGTPKECMTT